MRRLSFLGVVLCGLLIGFGIRSSRAQQGVSNRMAGEVRQGGTLRATLTVDKTPSIPITLTATASAVGQSYSLDAGCRINAGTTSCEASALIPLDAPVGQWRISKVQMQPLSGGQPKVLSEQGDLSFHMLPHETVTLPSSVRVSGIQ